MSASETKEGLVFGLDIGTRAVVGVVGYREKDTFVVKAIESIEHESRAMIDGQIHDINKVAVTVGEIKERLEKKCKITLKDVCIAAAGRVLKTEEVHVEIEYDDETLILEEQVFDLISKGVEEAYKKFQSENEFGEKYYCVGKSVIKYFMNDMFILNLLNHKARKIACDMICTFLPYDVVEGLYAAVEIAGLDVANLTLEPIAAIEVAIPEKFRMLNIALVDVGAGTSDICITKDGSVVAYGMIPIAGDSLTEIIANYCLVEFNEAEKIKKGIEHADEVEYEDILGLKNTISKKDVLELLDSHIREMAKQASDEIIRLNGGNKVSAIFVVGGGGRIENYTKYLAETQDIQVNRVAVRGEDVMGKIIFKDDSVVKDSLIVTPLGICLHFYEENNSFVNVSINDERLKLYDNGNLAVVDAVMQIGLDNNALFPRRGDSLVFTLNGEEKVVKGELGEACVVYLNSELTNLHAPLHANDIINLVPSTKGEPGSMTLARLNSSNPKLKITVNKMNVTLPNLCTVNGEIEVDSYSIQNGDDVEVLDYLKVSQVLELLDMELKDNEVVFVNNEEADMNTKVYARFNLEIKKKKELTYADLPEDNEYLSGEEDIVEESDIVDAEDIDSASDSEESAEDIKDAKDDSSEDKTSKEKSTKSSKAKKTTKKSAESKEETKSAAKSGKNKIITVSVNNQKVILKDKEEYVFVEVVDHIDFDLKNPKGTVLITNINGRKAEFLEPIKTGDIIEIYWEE
ncbi:MAG: rod shape-determining protein [Lachnospiraceae bacterium]|nr:rod shape-determining protein [Lachnospiraceae bacterium]